MHILTQTADIYYHVSNLRKCMGVNGEALPLHAVYKRRIFTVSHAIICISTISLVRISIRYYKSHALCLNVQ